MSGSLHTPGPWFGDGREKNGELLVYSERGRDICFIPEDDEQDPANANLISAAPDMLEALVDALAIIQAERDTMVECATMPPEHDIATLDAETRPHVEEYDAALTKIGAVLRKARGDMGSVIEVGK